MQRKLFRYRDFSNATRLGLFASILMIGMFCSTSEAQVFRKLHAFNSVPLSGSSPTTALIQGKDGSFYGSTSTGGIAGVGVLFKIDSTEKVTVLHAFTNRDGATPSALLQGQDGSFYGTTQSGGPNGSGTIFQVDSAGHYTVLYSFQGSDGYEPEGALIQGTDGLFYGTTARGGASSLGTLFRFDANAKKFTTLYSFSGADGSLPQGALVQGTDGLLYGTTSSGGVNGNGTLYRFDLTSSSFASLYSFSALSGNANTDGASPAAGLIQDTDGLFDGTASNGGTAGQGTLFRFDATQKIMTQVHSFTGNEGTNPQAPLIQAKDGFFYGTTYYGSSVFRYDTKNVVTTIATFNGADGANPASAVVQGADGFLYGTTQTGCASGQGGLYKVDTTGNLTLLFSFNTSTGDGTQPFTGLVQGADGTLYGTASTGGVYNQGVVFATSTTGVSKVQNYFTAPNGVNPQSPLLLGKDGSLYGSASQLSSSNYAGSLFQIDNTVNRRLKILHKFNGADGELPQGALAQDQNGIIYGTTPYGGTKDGSGTLFMLDPSGAKPKLTTLYSFSSGGPDGVQPTSGVILAQDGALYGTTNQGGANNEGTIFRYDLKTSAFKTLYSFSALNAGANSDGAGPRGTLLQASNGLLYGTASGGGTQGTGTLFSFDTSSQTLTTLYNFGSATSDGIYPFSALTQGSDGFLYGTTFLGGIDYGGVLFRFDPTSKTLTTLYNFGGPDGYYPQAPVIQGQDGKFYSTTTRGGGIAAGKANGTVFAFDLNTPTAPDITSKFKITYIPPALDAASGLFKGKVHLTNIDVDHTGVCTIVVNGLPQGILLSSADGGYGSSLLVPFFYWSGTLKAGASTDLTLWFQAYSNPGQIYTVQVFDGAF